MAEAINKNRLESWDIYYNNLKELRERGYIELPAIPNKCIHNAHMFYLKVT